MITNSSKIFLICLFIPICTSFILLLAHIQKLSINMLTISIRTTGVVTLIVPPVRTANGALAVVIKYLNDSVVFKLFS